MEDLHWVDPSTLEFLSLLVDHGPTVRILTLLTFRPDFRSPWTGRAHLTQVTLPRLPRRQAAEMMDRVAHGKALPPEVVAQVVAKTDGVPLFVEELTKMVLESGFLQERQQGYTLLGPLPPLAIPTTLHDSLMARLDRHGDREGPGATRGDAGARVCPMSYSRRWRPGGWFTEGFDTVDLQGSHSIAGRVGRSGVRRENLQARRHREPMAQHPGGCHRRDGGDGGQRPRVGGSSRLSPAPSRDTPAARCRWRTATVDQRHVLQDLGHTADRRGQA